MMSIIRRLKMRLLRVILLLNVPGCTQMSWSMGNGIEAKTRKVVNTTSLPSC